MKYDFIEIGTSDWDTLIQSTENKIGISIEPVKYYLDKLPNNPHVIKVNCGVSDSYTMSKVYWIEESDIIKHNLSWFLKGCNSIHEPHPVSLRELKEKNIEYLMKEKEIEILDWKTIVERYNVTEVSLLKLDCEGHDYVIVNNILDSDCEILPNEIKFEANELTTVEDRENTIKKAEEKGYELVEFNIWMAEVILKLKK